MPKGLFLKILINSLLGVVLVFIWSRFVDLSQILQTLKSVRLEFALLFFGLFFISGAIRGLRLKYLLKNYHIPYKDILMLHFLSQFLSFMIPVRAGEISKSIYLTAQFGLPLGKTITWVFVDRALDLMGILLIIAVFLPFISTNLPPNSSLISLGILILAITFSLTAIKSEQKLKKLVVFLSNFLIVPTIKRHFVSVIHTIIEGFDILRRHPLEFIPLVGFTTLAWVTDGLIWLVIFGALGVKIGFLDGVIGNGLAAFTFLVPTAPGYVGSAEAAGLAVWSGLLQMNANTSSAGMLLFHVLTLIILFVLGIGAIYLLKFDLNLVWKKIRGN